MTERSDAAGRPILVTGSHRSGTSWVGRMLAACPDPPIAYLWEPFSVLHRPGVCDARFPYWFPYVGPENQRLYRQSLQDMLAFRYKTMAEFRSVRSARDVGRLLRDRVRFARWRRQGARPLQKDPIALFSAGWLADTFDMDVVVLIRHPAAFVSSLKSGNLHHPFDDFLRQPLLMNRLQAHRPEIRSMAAERHDLVDQGILLWILLHEAIAGYQRDRRDWLFVRHEDLAVDPAHWFEAVYRYVGLPFTEARREQVVNNSSSSNPVEPAGRDRVRRDSLATAQKWKRRLSPQEIERIRRRTAALAGNWYGAADW